MPAPSAAEPGSAAREAHVDLLTATVERLSAELVGLRRAMATRAEIDQAKGAVRAVTGVSSDEAFALLSQRSQNTNRKLGDVARDVLAILDGPAVQPAALRQAVAATGQPGPAPAGRAWHSRRLGDSLLDTVQQAEQLRALADLGEQLAVATDRAELHDALLGRGADALGASAGILARIAGDGLLHVEHAGLGAGAPAEVIGLDEPGPVTDAVREGRARQLTRAELSLAYPAMALPDRLGGVAALPLGTDLAPLGGWLLCFDRPLPTDRSVRAFLLVAARMASGALHRVG